MRSWLFLGICFLISCHTQKSVEAPEVYITADQLAKEKYGDKYKILPNEDGSFSIVRQKTKKFEDLGFDVNFFVINHKNGEVVIEDNLRLGFVDWVTVTQIKAIDRKRDANNKFAKEIYFFDVVTKSKTIE